MNFGVNICKHLTVRTFSTGAEAEEICNGSGCNVVEKFKIDCLGHAIETQLHLGVLACLATVYHLLKSVGGETFVHYGHRVVHIRETVEDISGELFTVSDILSVIQQDKMISCMVVEDSLKFVSDLLYVFFPLSLEELQALACHHFGVLFLEVSYGCQTLVESRVCDFARHCDFDGSLIHCCSYHLKFNYFITALT